MQLGCSGWCGTRKVGYCDRPALAARCKVFIFDQIVLSVREGGNPEER